ncbi:queuosine-tRNA galactosyltransferase-like [Sycon ciliatum]|uniref:queuosine-tRNA galactosyltransferase-like n=1 Tax=Sycon ciliatum TaxID=27933 RepID=UPI0031F6F537
MEQAVAQAEQHPITVSVVMPMYNAAVWLAEALDSVLGQSLRHGVELSIFNDSSVDDSMGIIESYREKFLHRGIRLTVTDGGCVSGGDGCCRGPRGVGFAKNRAIEASCGEYLCFLDSDDVMSERRLEVQLAMAKEHRNDIIGSCFHRLPAMSTHRYTQWACSLSHDQLQHQVYTSNGPTVVMPTWFCHRSVFERAGPFDESGKGTPEDLLFFFSHLRHGGGVGRCDEDLLMYRYHENAATFSINRETIFAISLAELEQRVLATWPSFSIWNAGKLGRKFYRALCKQSRDKVVCFGDVDKKKLDLGSYTCVEVNERPYPCVPIRHFRQLRAPFVICMKQDLTGGAFEENLASLHLTEGVDYVFFG